MERGETGRICVCGGMWVVGVGCSSWLCLFVVGLLLLLLRGPLIVSQVLCEDMRFPIQRRRGSVLGKAELFRRKAFFGALDVIVEELA